MTGEDTITAMYGAAQPKNNIATSFMNDAIDQAQNNNDLPF
jgi:hypothetical protein